LALRAGRRTASFSPQQFEEFEMNTRRFPTDAGGDAAGNNRVAFIAKTYGTTRDFDRVCRGGHAKL
jgi:hypothetical protein